jgi:hypothetical protein
MKEYSRKKLFSPKNRTKLGNSALKVIDLRAFFLYGNT